MSNKPLSVDLALTKAKTLIRNGAPDQARQLYQEVLNRFPGNKRAIEGLQSLTRSNRGQGKTVPNAGPNQDQINGLISLYNQRRLQEALEQGTALAKQYPTAFVIHNILGAVNADLGRLDQAVASYSKALRIKPDYAEAYGNLGNALIALGKHEQAIASYTKALQINPDYAEAHNNLSGIKNYEIDDPQISLMQKQIIDPAIAESDKMHLSFALGKASDDIGDAESSFKHLMEGNRLRKKELGYDISSDRKLFSLIKSIFGADDLPSLEEIRPITEGKKRPIFVVGMPRSGTTLAEQILASHSNVFGAGELNALSKTISPILDDIQRAPAGKLAVGAIRDALNNYIVELDGLGGDEPYITDKMPLNFRWVGFILTYMPDAKIINLQRDPVATCWSVFKHYFSSTGNGYAHDLVDVAEFYRLYVDLMDFWRERFQNQIYDLDYEALTQNQEEESRKLLKYCDLDWEDQCMEFHKTERAIRTASSAQVRQEMYKGSSQEWRKYEPHLQPMIRVLRR